MGEAECAGEHTSATEVVASALDWLARGDAVALATVTQTWGSSPLPPGSQLAVNANRDFVGSVSGGCVEGAVIQLAQRVLDDGRAQTQQFGVSDAQAQEVGLACGGYLSVYIEQARAATLEALEVATRQRRSVVRCIDLDTGNSQLVYPTTGPEPPDASPLERLAREQSAKGTSAVTQHAGSRWFLELSQPPLRLLIVGAVHIAQYLARMATLAGYQVTVIDPRFAFATRTRFGATELVTEWPDRAIQALVPDHRTAVVALTHDAKLDEPALATALLSPAFYIGALGGERTQSARRQRLSARGIDKAALGRIHGPIGLALGGRHPAEIAIATLAQMTAVLRQGRAPGPLNNS